MSGGLLVDFSVGPQTPGSTTSEDNDAVNTDSARVYFGPLQSPEKKFVNAAMHTPLRRSARLSPVPPTLNEVQVNVEDQPDSNAVDSGSREGTPVHDLLPDEPSFVLASKVLHAQGNPSPPPSPEQHELALPLLRISGEETSDAPTPSATSASSPVRSPMPSPNVFNLSEQAVTTAADVTEPDLINFDSFSTPTPSLRQRTEIYAGTQESPSPTRVKVVTVDDLLAISPQRDPSGETNTSGPSLHGVNTSLQKERIVLESTQESSTEPQSMSPAGPQTPLRRSTRPRRSVSPFRPQVVSVPTGPPQDVLDPSRSHQSDVHLPHPSILTSGLRIQKKRRSRDVTLNGEQNVGGEQSLRTKPSVDECVVPEYQTIEAHRESVSLSPTLAPVSMQLVPNASGTVGDVSAEPAQATGSGSTELSTGSDTSQLTIMFPALAEAKSVPTINLLRPPTANAAGSSSPSKSTEVNRTPARRVPITQAIAEGTFSPHKRIPPLFAQHASSGIGVGLLGSPVFKRPALNDPRRSPAKRVPFVRDQSASLSSPVRGKTPSRPTSPIRASVKEHRATNSTGAGSTRKTERSQSAEPPTSDLLTVITGHPAHSRSRSASVDRNTQSSGARTTLPFPIVGSSSRLHQSIPEGPEGKQVGSERDEPIVITSSPPPSPPKRTSTLRQPSVGATSRIPRIGAKPYARPKPMEAASTAISRASTSTTNTGGEPTIVTVARPIRLVRTAAGNRSEGGSSASPSRLPEVAPRVGSSSSAAENPSAKTLKRKRDIEQSRVSSPEAQPVIVVRKVIPGMFNQSSKTASSPLASKSPVRRELSPRKPQGPVKMRRAVDWKRPPREIPVVANIDTKVQTPEGDSPRGELTAVQKSPTPPVSQASGASPTIEQPRPVTPTPLSELNDQSSSTRRSSRTRRSAPEAVSDVFGTTEPAVVRPLNVRRKRPPLSKTGAFSGMSAIALKALTSSNTAKNQHHVVEIQTEVIRKEGKRPDSPTTKVRTVLERQKELRAQQRHERAERRARKSADVGIADDILGEESIDGLGMSPLPIGADGMPLRHRRGPGDEEDYETPPRPDRPAKRERLQNDIGFKDGKRVKWDRGLVTTVYIDGSPPKPRRPDNEAVGRGCLTPAAKTLRLDTLGNVLNAETPLTDLVRENIIVKKFVYDDDDADAEVGTDVETPDPSPAPKPVKKSKKAKA